MAHELVRYRALFAATPQEAQRRARAALGDGGGNIASVKPDGGLRMPSCAGADARVGMAERQPGRSGSGDSPSRGGNGNGNGGSGHGHGRGSGSGSVGDDDDIVRDGLL